MYSYNKSVLSPYDPTKLAIHSFLRPKDDLLSNCGPKVKKTVPFDDVVHFIDEENMMTYVDFDFSITSFPETPTKSDRSNENGITFPDPVKNPNAFLATINIAVLLMSSIALISFWAGTIYGTWFQRLLSHSTTLMIHTLCSIRTLNQQLNNLEQTHLLCSPHWERWTVKRRDCASALLSFEENIYMTDEWTKQLLRLKSWLISGSPEQWMELHRLWWTVIEFKCSYSFQLFDFYYLLVQNLLFFEIFFVAFHRWFWERKKVHWQLLCNVTFP